MKHNHRLFLDIAKRVAQESSATRLMVGAVIAKDGSLIEFGYNGTPPGWSNNCEVNNATKPEVIHAEANCILKCAKLGKSVHGATLYLTHAPCFDCAKLILASGITGVWYDTDYRSMDGVRLLIEGGISVFGPPEDEQLSSFYSPDPSRGFIEDLLEALK